MATESRISSHSLCVPYFFFSVVLILALCAVIVRFDLPVKPENAGNIGQVSMNPIEWVAEPLGQNKPCIVRESNPLLLIATTDFDYIFEYMPTSSNPSQAPPEPSGAGANTSPNECSPHAIIFQAKAWFDRELTIARLENQAVAQRRAWANNYRKSK